MSRWLRRNGPWVLWGAALYILYARFPWWLVLPLSFAAGVLLELACILVDRFHSRAK